MSRYELFMMRQPKGKPISIYINTLLEAADFADIYQLATDKILITLTLATCKDDALKQELIKLDSTLMQRIQDEVSTWKRKGKD